jgi:hypothetical protein
MRSSGRCGQHRKPVVDRIDGGASPEPVLGADLSLQFGVGEPGKTHQRARHEIARALAPLELLGHPPGQQGVSIRPCLSAFRRIPTGAKSRRAVRLFVGDDQGMILAGERQ